MSLFGNTEVSFSGATSVQWSDVEHALCAFSGVCLDYFQVFRHFFYTQLFLMYHQLYFLPPLSCFHAHLLALSLYMHEYVCVCVDVYAQVPVCGCVCVCVCACMCTSTCVCVCAHARTCLCMYTYMHACMRVCVHAAQLREHSPSTSRFLKFISSSHRTVNQSSSSILSVNITCPSNTTTDQQPLPHHSIKHHYRPTTTPSSLYQTPPQTSNHSLITLSIKQHLQQPSLHHTVASHDE